MERIKLLSNEEAPVSSKEVLDEITREGHRVINIFKVMANSPAALKSFFGFHKALEEKHLSEENVERIAIYLAAVNGCEYCMAAHTYSGAKILSDEEIVLARNGKSDDPKANAVLEFADLVLKNAGKISDEDFDKAKGSGLSDAELLDIVTVVALNFFTNSINSVAQTRVDFPKPKV